MIPLKSDLKGLRKFTFSNFHRSTMDYGRQIARMKGFLPPRY